MKKLFTIAAFALMATAANAQTADSTFVRMDFNENPWNLPVSIPNRDLPGGSGNWAKVDDETGCLVDTFTFEIPVNGETIQVALSPANPKLAQYDNAMVKTHDLDDYPDEPIITMLWMRAGSTLTFKAPKSYWFAKVAIANYRNWSNGGLYSGDATNHQHIWGKDSVKVRDVLDNKGNLVYSIDCWYGDSVEWYMPDATGSTFLRYIDFWLLPRKGIDLGISERMTEGKAGDVLTLDGVLLRRDGNTEGLRKGIYVSKGKKFVVK